MTEETLAIIQKVAKKFANKYSFAYYDPADIEQEAFILAMEALPRYKGTGPLENFLSVHVRNRLLNLRRKIVERSNSEAVLNKLCIDGLEETIIGDNPDLLEKMSIDEIRRLIDENLEVEYRLNFLRLCEGKTIPRFQREKIVTRIKEIIGV